MDSPLPVYQSIECHRQPPISTLNKRYKKQFRRHRSHIVIINNRPIIRKTAAATTTTEAVARANYRINNRHQRIMSAEVHQNEYFHNPYASNATKFYDLNDDVCLEIFQRLTVLDLCAIRYTCKRFDALAEYFFKMVYKTLNFSNWNIKGEYSLLTEDEMKTILTTFGGQMDSITVNADSFEPESKVVLQIINEFCGAKRLRFFKMVIISNFF